MFEKLQKKLNFVPTSRALVFCPREQGSKQETHPTVPDLQEELKWRLAGGGRGLEGKGSPVLSRVSVW